MRLHLRGGVGGGEDAVPSCCQHELFCCSWVERRRLHFHAAPCSSERACGGGGGGINHPCLSVISVATQNHQNQKCSRSMAVYAAAARRDQRRDQSKGPHNTRQNYGSSFIHYYAGRGGAILWMSPGCLAFIQGSSDSENLPLMVS